jgi:hypothetical protein
MGLGALVALAVSGCAEAPEADQIAQATMIGLPARAALACMGRPVQRTAPAEATEIWTYRSGVTTTSSPPWGPGLDFGALRLASPCDVRIVMTNAHVSQVFYTLPDGRALPSGQQCAFAAGPCAALAGPR